MTKSRISIIILLMSSALLGIILVQVYWINNTIAQKEKIFDFQVNDALNKVADKMEMNITASIMNSLSGMGLDSDYWQHSDTSLTVEKLMNDTMLTKVIRSTKEGENYYEESEIKISASPYTSFSDPLPGLEGKPTLDLGSFEFKSGDVTSDPDGQLISELLKNIDKQFQVNADRFSRLMRQMLIESMNMGINPEEKIDTKFLEKTLNNELANRGITTGFNYAVLLNNNYLLCNAHDAETQDKILRSRHKVNLFPNDIFSNSDLLLVDFPNQRTYFLSSIWSLLVGSLIFTAIIIIVFSYTIYIIFRQKKISEIKTDFINNMTHEFKTPLATISLAVDAINNPQIVTNENRVKHYTQIIREENRRMNGQVEKVLQMALLDKHQIKLSNDEVDMHDIIARAVENISIQVEEKGGKISTELNADRFEIIADEVHMMNVIYNLLDNANKYSPEKPDIVVRTKSDTKGIYITVADHGLGMSPEEQKLIFEKFYRVHTGNLHNIKGFGLGLTYVKAIVDAHNGNIHVKSQLKKGSEFTIYLPFTQ